MESPSGDEVADEAGAAAADAAGLVLPLVAPPAGQQLLEDWGLSGKETN